MIESYLPQNKIPVCLTIAGSDSGGGAGIQADIKTFEAHHVFGTSVITAVTAQNTLQVKRVWDVPVAMVLDQLEAIWADFEIATVKTGMLSSAEIVQVVATFLRDKKVPLVVDPVMVSTSGNRLLQPNAIEAYTKMLFPLATLITPNAHEAAVLCGMEIGSIRTPEDAIHAAEKIAKTCPGVAILVKGAHIFLKDGPIQNVDDILYVDGITTKFSLPFVHTKNTHGTGCTLSAAIAAQLAHGKTLTDAIRLAKQYVHDALKQAPEYLGKGHGPLLHHIPVREA